MAIGNTATQTVLEVADLSQASGSSSVASSVLELVATATGFQAVVSSAAPSVVTSQQANAALLDAPPATGA